MEVESKKKLLITASTFPRWKNDTEPRFILDYAKAMSRYYNVAVLVPGAVGAKVSETLEGVQVYRYHYFPVHSWETLCYPGAIVPRIKEKKGRVLLVPFLLAALWINLKKIGRDFDIIHVHWLIPQGIVQPFAGRKPFILTGHGGDVTSLNVSIIRLLKKKCLKCAGEVTVVSEALAATIEEICPGRNVSVIPMGCDTTLFSPFLRKTNFFGQSDKKVILFVGRLAEKKGVTYLIDAMKSVEDAILVIVGKGDLEEKLKKQAAQLGNKVQFLGPKTHHELPQIYASADLFVAPSITARDGDKEGFGLVIIEAMASGIPVVASRSGGIIDIIEDGVNGLLAEEKDSVQLANQINKLLCDKKLYDAIVQKSLQTAQKYDYKSIASQYHELIERL